MFIIDLILYLTDIASARQLSIPLARNLAGGYQGPLRKVLDVHDARRISVSGVPDRASPRIVVPVSTPKRPVTSDS
jgi:hypothetical protein